MTRSDAVGVMSERTRAILRRVLSVRFSSWLYPSDESRSEPSTDEDGGRESAIDFPSKTRFLAVAPGAAMVFVQTKSPVVNREVKRRGTDEGLRLRRYGRGFGGYRPGGRPAERR